MRTHRHFYWVGALVLLLGLATACATMFGSGMSAEEMARAHWAAIQKNDMAGTTQDYTDGTSLDWVGGPLNGKYTGKTAIAGVWGKFFGAQGPLTADISNVMARAEGGKQVVTARTIFKGKATVPVDYTLVYDGGSIVSETWKIRP
jgi:hypothetical protein